MVEDAEEAILLSSLPLGFSQPSLARVDFGSRIHEGKLDVGRAVIGTFSVSCNKDLRSSFSRGGSIFGGLLSWLLSLLEQRWGE